MVVVTNYVEEFKVITKRRDMQLFNGIKDIRVGKMNDIIILIKSISTLKMKSEEPYQKLTVRDRDGSEATIKLMAIAETAAVQQSLDRDLLMAAVLYYSVWELNVPASSIIIP